MTINFFEGNISSTPHVFDEHQVVKCVFEMEHGDVGYIDDEAWWPGYDHKANLDGNAVVHEDEYIEQKVDEMADNFREGISEDEDDELDDETVTDLCMNLPFARVICLTVPLEDNDELLDGEELDEDGKVKGFIIDASSDNYVSNGEMGERMHRGEGPYDDESINEKVRKMRVIGWVGNVAELKEIKTILSSPKYAINIGQSALNFVLDHLDASEGPEQAD